VAGSIEVYIVSKLNQGTFLYGVQRRVTLQVVGSIEEYIVNQVSELSCMAFKGGQLYRW
jgi:hypothetical protein